MGDFLAGLPKMRSGKTERRDGGSMHSERFVIDERRLPADDTPGVENVRTRKRTTEPVRDQDGGGSLSDGMRRYILAYGGPITAECTNPFPAAS
jgi:hypothetical protein